MKMTDTGNTHFADDDTIQYIAKLEAEVEQLRQERDAAIDTINGLKTGYAAANAEIARLRDSIELLQSDYRDLERYWHDKMSRWGTPHVGEVSMMRDGVRYLLPIVDATPSKRGLMLEVGDIGISTYRRAEEAEREVQEQARLLGMGSEREARLMAKVKELEAERDDLIATQWVQGEQYAAATCVIEKCYAALSEESAAYEEPLAHVEEALAAIDEYRTQSGHDRTQKEQGC